MQNKKKIRLISGIVVLSILVILILIPPALKLYINHSGPKLIGRNIALKKLHFNYFRARFTLKDFVIYEANEKDTFVSFSEFTVNFDPWKLTKKELAFSEISLLDPYVNIEQNGSEFNFSDIIEHVSKSDSTNTTTKEPKDTTKSEMKFSVSNVHLGNGEVKYYDKLVDNLIDIIDLNINLPELSYNSANAKLDIGFSINNKGTISISSFINSINKEYSIQLNTNNIQLNTFTNYLKQSVNISDFNAFLQTQLLIDGSMDYPENITVKGTVGVDSLYIIDGKENELFRLKSFETNIDNISLADSTFNIKSIAINQPKVFVTLGKEQSNIEYFLAPSIPEDGTETSGLETDTIETTTNASDTTRMPTYSLENFTLTEGSIKLIDSTLNRLLKYKVDSIFIQTDSLTNDSELLTVNYGMSFPNKGNLKGITEIGITEAKELYLDGHIEHLDLHDFSPYTEYYLGYPILSGYLYYDCLIKMTPEKLQNKNHIVIEKIEFGPSNSDIDTSKVPIKLALIVLKDRHGNVDINIPINGNPSDPNFSLVKIMLRTLTKFTIKAATSPLKLLRSILLGSSTTKLSYIPFEYTQDTLQKEQRKTLDDIAKILDKKPELSFTFRQDIAIDQEIGQLAAKEVKTKYVTETNQKKDWHKIKDDDDDFISYLNQISPNTQNLEIADRYLEIVTTPKDQLMDELKALYIKRNQGVLHYLIENKGCDSSSVNTLKIDPETLPQKLDIPGFQVEVSAK